MPSVVQRIDAQGALALDEARRGQLKREGALSVYALNNGGQAQRISVQLLSQEADTSLVELDEALARARVVDFPPPDLADGALVLPGGGS